MTKVHPRKVNQLKLLAFDYGASSGRAMLGTFDGERLELTEVHRFANDPVTVNGSMYWDVLRLFHELKQGVRKAAQQAPLACVGVDTWGVDFGLLDCHGDLLGNAYHYRDQRTEGMVEFASGQVPLAEIYEATGIAIQKFNTLYQLIALKHQKAAVLEQARTLLFIPDLFNYFLTGQMFSEYTIASTSQLVGADSRNWHYPLLERLGIPTHVLTELIPPGMVLGSLRDEVAAELGVKPFPVAAVAGHDTASAVAAVPADRPDYLYISSGTWSLLGIETNAPVNTPDSFRLNFTNEGGINHTVRVLKNIMGLWIIQECKRYWDRAGATESFQQLMELAEAARPFTALIDPDDPVFYSPGQMPQQLVAYCHRTGQTPPHGKGEIVRVVLEGLALKYRMVAADLEQTANVKLPVIHIIGGGSQNTLLNQFTANACQRPVKAGPVEATAIGNLIGQLLAVGAVADLTEARLLVRNSFPVQIYEPRQTELWDETYGRFVELIRNTNQNQ